MLGQRSQARWSHPTRKAMRKGERNMDDLSPERPASFEAAIAQLEAIVHQLEEGQIGLAESLSRYEEGVRLLRQCYAVLEQAERKIELLTGVDPEGNPKTVPFDDQSTIELDENGQPRTQRRAK